MKSSALLSFMVSVLGSVLPGTAFAANEGGSHIIGRFDSAFDDMDSLIFGRDANRQTIFAGGAVPAISESQPHAISPELDLALQANTAAKIHESNGATGLQLTGQTYWRIAGNGGVDDVAGDTGQGYYKAKFQAELRWYFLQSSLFGKEERRNIAELEERIARAGYEKEKIDINEFMVQQQIDLYYDSITSGVLQHRVDLLQLLDDAQRYLLGNENIKGDDITRTLNELLDAQRKLTEIEGIYPKAISLAGIKATTVAIDSAALIKHVASEQGDMKILQLRMELLEQREKNVKWWSNINVAPFIRYSNYFRRDIPDTYNVDAGLTFTIPLNDEFRRKKRTLATERAILESEQERLSRRVADKTAIVVAEVGRLDRASINEIKRIDEIKKYLLDRNNAYRKGKGEHNRLSRAREYTMYISCLERLIDYQYRRDCLIANLQSLLPDETILRFVHFKPI